MKVFGTVILCIFLVHGSFGMVHGGVELCYSFRPVARGSEDQSVLFNNTLYFSLTAKQLNAEPGGPRIASVQLKALRDDRPFQGVILRAIPTPINPSMWETEPLPMGIFHPAPELELLSCFRGLDNVVLYYNDAPSSAAIAQWSPPLYRGKTPGNVTFVATVIESPTKYWYGVSSEVVVV